MLKSSVDKRGEEGRGDQGRAGHDEEGPTGDDQLWGADYDDQPCGKEEERGCDKTRWPENSTMSAHQPCPTWRPGSGSEWDHDGQGKWGRSEASNIRLIPYISGWERSYLGCNRRSVVSKHLQAWSDCCLHSSFQVTMQDSTSEYFISIKLSRAREDHLVLWLRHMHPILARQQLAYQVFSVGIIFEINFIKIFKMISTITCLQHL